MSQDAQETLRLMVAHESALSRLYVAYSETFDGFRDLWVTLAAEEHQHAMSLGGLANDSALADWLTPEIGPRAQALRSSIEYAETQTSRARQGGLTAVQALAVAKDIEDALIDRLELVPVAPHCTEIARVLAELREETGGHRQMLAAALETAKGQGR